MKKNIFGLILTVLTYAAFAELPTGDFMTWFGYEAGKDANGSGTSLYGAMAGQDGSYLNYSVLLGTLSGYRAYSMNRSVGLGPWSMHLSTYVSYSVAIGASAGRDADAVDNCVFIGNGAGRGATLCTNCVFIGKGAGAGMSGNGCVDIGGVFVYSNGVATVKGLGLDRKLDMINPNNRNQELVWGDGSLNVFAPLVTTESATFGGVVSAPDIRAGCVSTSSLVGESADGSSYVLWLGAGPYSVTIQILYDDTDREDFFKFNNEKGIRFSDHQVPNGRGGSRCENIDERITRISSAPRTSITIEDEDTGERYIIKVKSGALKLYKVEETEE